MNRETQSLMLFFTTLLLLVVSAFSAFLFPHLEWLWEGSLVLAALCGVGYAILDKNNLKNILKKRTTLYGLNSLFTVVIVLVIVVFANTISVQHDIKKDLTKNKLHTLSEQSIKVLKDLKSDLKIVAFVYPNQIQEFDKIFDKYAYYSSKLKKEYIDIDKDPIAAEQKGIKQAGTILVEGSNRSIKIENLTGEGDPRLEEKITNAIIQVTKGGKKKLYYTTGHGEKLLTDTSRAGYSEIKDQLEKGRFDIEELALLKKGEVPKDAEVVICTGPISEFMDLEIKALETYIRNGGKLLLMVEPNSPAILKTLVTKFGIDWHKGKTVFEANSLERTKNPLTPLVDSYSPSSEITQNLKQYSIFSIPTPVEKNKETPKDYKVISLFSTSPRSYELNIIGDKVNITQKPERMGPLSLAVSVSGKEDKKEEFRIVVVGDSDFASNGLRRFGVNADLFQNMVSWLAKEEDLIAIRPKTQEGGQFDITDYRAQVIFLTSVILAPVSMFITAIAVWLRRRKK